MSKYPIFDVTGAKSSLNIIRNKLDSEIKEFISNDINISILDADVGVGKTITTLKNLLEQDLPIIYVADSYFQLEEIKKHFNDQFNEDDFILLKGKVKITFEIAVRDSNNVLIHYADELITLYEEGLNSSFVDSFSMISDSYIKEIDKIHKKQFKDIKKKKIIFLTKKMFQMSYYFKEFIENTGLKFHIVYDEEGVFEGNKIEFKQLYTENDEDVTNEILKRYNNLIVDVKNDFFKYLEEDKNPIELKNKGIINTGSTFLKYSFPKRKTFDKNISIEDIIDSKEEFEEYLNLIDKTLEVPFQKNAIRVMMHITGLYSKSINSKEYLDMEQFLERNPYYSFNEEIENYALTTDFVNKSFIQFLEYFDKYFERFINYNIARKRRAYKAGNFSHKQINIKRITNHYIFLRNVLLTGDMYCQKSKDSFSLFTYEYSVLKFINDLADKHKIYILDASFNQDALNYVTEKLFVKTNLINYIEIKQKNNFTKYNYLNIDMKNKNTFVLYNDFYKNGKSIYGIGRKVGNKRENQCGFWLDEVKEFKNEIIEPYLKAGAKLGLITHQEKITEEFEELFKKYKQEHHLLNYPAKGSNMLEDCEIIFVIGNKHYGDNEYIERSYFQYDNLEPLVEENIISEKDIVSNFYDEVLRFEIDELTYQAIGRIRPFSYEQGKSKIIVLFGWFPEKLRNKVSVIRQRLPNDMLKVIVDKLLKDGTNDENYVSFNYVTEKEAFDLLDDVFKETIKNMKAMTRKPRRLKDYFEADKKTLKLEKTALFSSMWDFKIKNKNYNN